MKNINLQEEYDMNALRLIEKVSEDGYLHIKVPPEMGENIELIILPFADSKKNESVEYMKMQEESGFVRNVLASEKEDVWNDV